MIRTGAEKVWPEEVEGVLAGHPKVADVAVAGRPDPEWGSRVSAFVVPRVIDDPPSLDELRALGADHLARFKLPTRALPGPRRSLGPARGRCGATPCDNRGTRPRSFPRSQTTRRHQPETIHEKARVREGWTRAFLGEVPEAIEGRRPSTSGDAGPSPLPLRPVGNGT